ncbi:hypothetical protein [Alkalicoccus daliensis]|uniref:Uncharacterized protein n=1 Tax=Alkalicoccus daliensis TaxID=745820 RepID=A0A1H0GY08_9BACI|nr:hypothetical protein [Alkalicoccus daliensis]SDO11926.1 hypothetical protein SAMN04488053_10794 [Alkalicoccus daliensis]
MKKMHQLIYIIMLAAFLTACGNSEVNNEPDVSETDPENNELYNENEANEEVGNNVEEAEEFNEVNEPEE